MTRETADPVALSRSAKGILLMILAMLSIPLVDGLAKHLSRSYSPLFISWARYAVACGVVLPFAAAFLIGAAAVGFLAFQEVPGPSTLVGSGLIAAAGMMLIQR